MLPRETMINLPQLVTSSVTSTTEFKRAKELDAKQRKMKLVALVIFLKVKKWVRPNS
jgi:hypothetical protein